MPKTRALEREEIHKLFACISGKFALRNQTMLICGISMALRATELVSLNVGDVMSRRRSIKTYVTIRPETAKFGKARRVRLGSEVKTAIKAFIEHKRTMREPLRQNTPLFVSRQGGHMKRQSLFALLQKILKKADIDESPHALRKTGATAYYIESHYDLLATQEFLGHTDPSSTREYIGLDTEKLIEYSESLSQFLFSSIRGEFDTKGEMSNSLKENSDADLILELQKRGHDVSELLARIHRRELKDSRVVSIDAIR